MSTPDTATAPDLQALQAALPAEVRRLVRRASELERRHAGCAHQAPLTTSIAALDTLLDGGLPRGALVELVGRGSCGRLSTLLATLQQVTDTGEAAVLIDQGSQLDPQSAAAAGIVLDRLLWLRPTRLDDSLAAAEMLLATGFGFVALDLGLPPVLGRPPLAAWLRLARSAADRQAVVLVGAPYRLSGCASTIVISGGWGRGRWSGRAGGSRLLDGLTARLKLDRNLGARPRPETDVVAAFTTAEAAFRETLSTSAAAPSTRRHRHAHNI
jgi:hypothetical protein